MKLSKRLKPPYVLKPGLGKPVYLFPEDYCTLTQFDRLYKRMMRKNG